ncbi:isoprenylcysteine carboxylmethyltransferase family protein [Janibacter terrae]|uniref:Isoprenylcysteine carboxylmethyltransferase family protein n=1 Tax=Janibacter terrae TaxID=103817 RepID=A0ABZ2FGE3_9MICO
MAIPSILRSPPVVGLASLAAQRVLARGSTSPGTSALGAAVAVAGVALLGAGIRQIRSAGTTLDPMHPEGATALVRDGIFRHSRNPIYLGDALLLTGHAIHRRDLRALLPVAVFVGVIDLFQIPEEEAAMLATFGSRYGDYVATVRRWF